MVSKEKMNPIAPDSLKGRAPGVEPGNEQGGVPQGSNIQRGNENLQRDTAGVGERGGVASQQTGWAARQSAERMQQRAAATGAGETVAGAAGQAPQAGQALQGGQAGASLQQDQHAGSQESATGPAGKRQTDEARPKLSRARKLDK